MTALRIFLISFLAILTLYTLIVIGNHGLNLFAVFFGDMAAMTWAGQFNLDFTGFLILSALWVTWPNQFSGTGFALCSRFFWRHGFSHPLSAVPELRAAWRYASDDAR